MMLRTRTTTPATTKAAIATGVSHEDDEDDESEDGDESDGDESEDDVDEHESVPSEPEVQMLPM